MTFESQNIIIILIGYTILFHRVLKYYTYLYVHRKTDAYNIDNTIVIFLKTRYLLIYTNMLLYMVYTIILDFNRL